MMRSPDLLGIQAVRRTLDDVRDSLQDNVARDRLARIDIVLSRIAAHLELDPVPAPDQLPRQSAIDREVARIQRREAKVASLDPRRRRLDAAGDTISLPETMQSYLTTRFPESPNLTVVSARHLPGGRSKHTYIVETTGGNLPAKIVLRADSTRTTIHDNVAREFPLIEAVYAAGSPAPRPLWFESDASIIGGAFIAFAHAAGAVAGDLYGAAAGNDAPARALALALAHLHQLPLPEIAAPAGQSGQAATRALFASYEARWNAAKPGPSLAIADAFAFLSAHAETLTGAAVIVHGDAHFANMLMHEGKLTALLDWEFWHAGHPAEDLAYCRPYIEQTMQWTDFLGVYAAAGGTLPTTTALDLFAVWRPLRNAVLAANVAFNFQAQEDLDLETAAIALSTYPKMEAQVALALQLAQSS